MERYLFVRRGQAIALQGEPEIRRTWVVERIGKNTFAMALLAAHDATNSRKVTAKRAQDSVRTVTMSLYHPVTDAEGPGQLEYPSRAEQAA